MRAQYNDTSALHNVISVLLCSVDLISLRQTSSGLPPDIPCPVNALQVGYLTVVTSHKVTSRYVTSRYVVIAVTSRYLTWRVMWRHIMWRHVMWRDEHCAVTWLDQNHFSSFLHKIKVRIIRIFHQILQRTLDHDTKQLLISDNYSYLRKLLEEPTVMELEVNAFEFLSLI